MKGIKKWFTEQYTTFKTGENPMFGIGLLMACGLVSICILPILFTRETFFPSFMGTGAVGDTINGIAGPFIALGAAVLTFLAFYAQLNANNAQKKQFQDQADDVKLERFENRFFELLRIHRSNVEEQNIQNRITGRKVFTTYYFELRYIYYVLRRSYQTERSEPAITVPELTNLAYLIFFYGIGHVTKSVFEQIAPSYCELAFFKAALKRLESDKEAYRPRADATNENLEVTFSEEDKAIFIQVYQPFTGHGTKIGHYYRHMLQAVSYVDGQDSKFLSDQQKDEYVKMLRAQLSNFEQILLHYNSVSLLGPDWEKYIIKYRMITNLPLAFADFGLTPEAKYSDIIAKRPDFFNWIKIKAGLELPHQKK